MTYIVYYDPSFTENKSKYGAHILVISGILLHLVPMLEKLFSPSPDGAGSVWNCTPQRQDINFLL
jgi:hypothetical protein